MKKNLIITILAAACLMQPMHLQAQQQPQQFTIGGLPISPDMVAHALIATAEIASDIAKKTRAERNRKIHAFEEELIELGKLRDQHNIGAGEYDQRSKLLNDNITALRKEADEDAKASNAIGTNVQTAMLDGWKSLLEGYNEERRRTTQVAVAAVSKAVEVEEGNKGAMERLEFVSQPEHLRAYATGMTLAAIGIFGGYYGIKLIHKYLNEKLNKEPLLVRTTSRKSLYTRFIDGLVALLYGAPTQETLDDVILAPEIEKIIRTLAQTTKTACDKGLPYRNVLFYGPPGTGKTKVAKILAQTSGLDYAIMSGADLSQFAEGADIQALHELFDWAESGNKGTILFIDEADALLRKRTSNNMSERSLKLLDAFLSLTGKPSTKFMIIFATNHPEVLDKALKDRTDEQIKIDLPGQTERVALINMYLTKLITNDHRTIKIKDQEVDGHLLVDPTITPTYLNDIAKQLEGFSGRKIEQLLLKLQSLCYLKDDLTLTTAMVDEAVKAALEQKEANEKMEKSLD